MPAVMRVRRGLWARLSMALGLLVLAACGRERAAAPEPAANAPAANAPAELSARGADGKPPLSQPPPAQPPQVAFVAPQPWQSTREGVPPIDPPPLPTWRVLVSQNQPLQAKTPKWQPLPPRETVELAMPMQGGFRCVVTPLQMTAEANDFGTKLKAWLLVRSLLCSGDGFQRWTEHVHSVRVPAGGAPEATETGILLRERDAAHGVRQMYVLLRTDEETRAATTGPPRILPGVRVDED